MPRPAQALAGAAVGRLPVDHRNFSFDFKLKQFLRARPSRCRWPTSAGWARSPAREIARLLVDGDPIGIEAEHLRRAEALGGGSDPLSRSLALYQDTYLPEDILTKVDRASMACGLEVRAPFLDAELVDFIQALPAVVQVRPQPDQAAAQARGGQPAAGVDPGSAQEGIRHPGGGAGCAARWPRWWTQLLGRERLERQGLFRPEEVARRIAEHQAGTRDHRKPLWTLLMFQLWCDHWLG